MNPAIETIKLRTDTRIERLKAAITILKPSFIARTRFMLLLAARLEAEQDFLESLKLNGAKSAGNFISRRKIHGICDRKKK